MTRSSRAGFTLIEMLAVVALIGVVITFAVPAISTMLQGSQMTQAGQQLHDSFLLGRQLAVSTSRPVEVRFYKYGDPDTPGEAFDKPESGKWRAIQLFTVLESGVAVPITDRPMFRFPKGVILHDTEYSTLLNEELRPHVEATTDATAPELPVDINNKKVGRNYWYTSFRYLPDGSTDLPPFAVQGGGEASEGTRDQWYVSMIGLEQAGKELRTINFYTVQVDPISGTLKSFRPTIR